MISKRIKGLGIASVIIAVGLVGIEICLDAFLLSMDGGAPSTQTGRVSIENLPGSDAEFAATSMMFLSEVGWRESQSILYLFGRKVECHQAQLPPAKRLLDFRTWDRLTLITSRLRQASIELDADSMQLNYTIDDYGPERALFTNALDLTQVRIESDEALERAEQSGGESLRALVGNRCYVSISLGPGEPWRVDYIRQDSVVHLLCFDIDTQNGDIKRVAQRSNKVCEYSESIRLP